MDPAEGGQPSSGHDLPHQVRGRPRKDRDLSERSVRRRIAEEFNALLPSPGDHPLPPAVQEEDSYISDELPDTAASQDLGDFGVSGENPNLSSAIGEVQVSVPCQAAKDSNDRDEDVLASRDIHHQDSLASEGEFDEHADLIRNLATLHIDCDVCVNCQCIDCNICVHSADGNCFHCDSCSWNVWDLETGNFGDVLDSYGEDFSEGAAGREESEGDDPEEEVIISEEEKFNNSLKSDLVDVFLRNKLSHVAIDDILGVMRKYDLGNLPKSAKTLLQTAHSVQIKSVPPGQYWHNGITKQLTRYLCETGSSVVNIKFSTDGVPLFKSTNHAFWPITCIFNNDPQVHLIGLYLGIEKPADSNVFLEDFVAEVSPLCQDGLNVGGKIGTVNVECGIFDAMARSFVLKVKYCNAQCGCFKCMTEGEMIGRRMSFCNLNDTLRTDESFRNHQQEEYHSGRTILEEIPRFGCVSCVPLDYMHLLLLGIMRKLMYLWLAGPLQVRLGANQGREISDLLIGLIGWVPSEFTRRTLRSLVHIKRFKATEFRLILLYVGLVVFQKMPRRLFDHFIVFHVISTIYADPSFCVSHLEYARKLAVYFVESFIDLYGREYVSHNVHSIIHLHADVQKFGALDKFSAFPFENFYRTLTKLVRKGEKPLHQVAKRYLELESNSFQRTSKPQSKPFQGGGRHSNGILLEDCFNPQYRLFTIPGGYTISSDSEADRCCVVGDCVLLAQNFATNSRGETVLIGREFLLSDDVYQFPCPSSVFGIKYVRKPSRLKVWPASLIVRKCFLMPWKEGFIIVPLHKQEQ